MFIGIWTKGNITGYFRNAPNFPKNRIFIRFFLKIKIKINIKSLK